jgi:hypothetical protein
VVNIAGSDTGHGLEGLVIRPQAPLLLVGFPAYVSPGTTFDTDIAGASPKPALVVMDNNNGDSAMTSTWTAQADTFRSAGIMCLAYSYITPDAVTLRTWASFQTSVQNALVTGDGILHFDGMFLDLSPNTVGSSFGLTDYITFELNAYAYIQQVAQSVVPGRRMFVAANAGAPYQDTIVHAHTADIYCTFEGTEAGYNGTGWSNQPGNLFTWGSGGAFTNFRLGTEFPPWKFWHIIYATASAASMKADIATAVSRRAGWVTATDQTGTDPYATPPSLYTVSAVTAQAALQGGMAAADYPAISDYSGTAGLLVPGSNTGHAAEGTPRLGVASARRRRSS